MFRFVRLAWWQYPYGAGVWAVCVVCPPAMLVSIRLWQNKWNSVWRLGDKDTWFSRNLSSMCSNEDGQTDSTIAGSEEGPVLYFLCRPLLVQQKIQLLPCWLALNCAWEIVKLRRIKWKCLTVPNINWSVNVDGEVVTQLDK